MQDDDIVNVIKEWKRVYEEEGALLRQKHAEDGDAVSDGQEEGHVQIFEVSAVRGARQPGS